MGGQKPHLLTGARNNLGAETRVTYAPSTRFYVADETAGRPWVTRLPFPGPGRRARRDDRLDRPQPPGHAATPTITATSTATSASSAASAWSSSGTPRSSATTPTFDDGDFVNWDQQSWSPPVLTRTWFHTGAFADARPSASSTLERVLDRAALRAPGRAADAAAMRLPDTRAPRRPDAFEIQEAYRALKGHALRVEVYAERRVRRPPPTPTRSPSRTSPSAACRPSGTNRHAVFFVIRARALSFHYERGRDRPAGQPRARPSRPTPTATCCAQRLGRLPAPRRLPAARTVAVRNAQAMLAYDQARLHIRGTEQRYTNAIDDLATWPDAYRVPLPSAADDAEITGVAPSVKGDRDHQPVHLRRDRRTPAASGRRSGPGRTTSPTRRSPPPTSTGPAARPPRPPGGSSRGQRVLYRSDDLTALLPPGQLQPRALPGQSYQAALTPGLLTAIFGAAGARGDPHRRRLRPAARARRAGGSRPGGSSTRPGTATRRPRNWQPPWPGSSCRAGPSTRSAPSPGPATTPAPCCRSR